MIQQLTVEDVRRPLTGPSTAVGAALEQVCRVSHVTPPPSSTAVAISITVSVCITALDTHRRKASRLRLWRTGARSDGVHSLKEPATVATTGSIAPLQRSITIIRSYSLLYCYTRNCMYTGTTNI